MSDRFYDNKGIERLTKENAEYANRQYLRDEQAAREKGIGLQRQQVEIQRQQVEMQRQTVEAAERAASEAKRARLEQENHCRQMERLKQAELDEQRNYVQFNKDVAFLEGESDEAKIDYILKRSLQGGSSNSFSAVHQAPLRNRLMGMLEERLELHPGIKRVSMAMAEQKSVWENAKSKLNSAESRIAQLTPVPTTGRYKLAALFGASGAIFVFWGVLLSLIYGAPPEDTSVVSLK